MPRAQVEVTGTLISLQQLKQSCWIHLLQWGVSVFPWEAPSLALALALYIFACRNAARQIVSYSWL